MAHTPKPWVVRENNYGCKEIGRWVDGEFQSHAQTDGIEESEDVANAYLMAAAPYLLEAAKYAVAANLFEPTTRGERLKLDLQAAIDKATTYS